MQRIILYGFCSYIGNAQMMPSPKQFDDMDDRKRQLERFRTTFLEEDENGEVVNGIDPRTVPASASYSVSEHTTVLAAQRSAGHTYSQTVVDSVYGHQNASFIYTQAQGCRHEF